MKNPWKKISSKVVHKNNWFQIRKDKVITPDGKKGEYNVLVSPASVYIVAINDKKQIHLVGLYRYTTSTYSIEIPAGSTDGEAPLKAAKKELKEEAGLTAKTWKLIGKFQSANGFMSEMGYVYLATDLKNSSDNKQKEEGIDKVIVASMTKVLKMVEKGEINDAQTLAALQFVQLAKI